MKNKLKFIFVLILASFMVFAVAGCSASGAGYKTPQDVIKDAYGNEQFQISFYAGTLEEPIADMYYSAKDMPTLPTPEKVGYIFAGWFFDSALTDPCDVSDGDLYWKMCDVTLYAKWEKEAIYNNGTYDIDFEAHIVESSVTKGTLADQYGWYKFPDDIVEGETYIEKNDSGTFLRIQYDCHERGPIFEGTEFATQTYTISDGGAGRISEELSVLDRTSTIQTIYYDISDMSLSDTITLYITYWNWGAELANESDREKCSVGYTVEFNITRFIGFSQSFVNSEGKLDDGVYLVPTHYTGLDKSAAMLDSFHPVYSYIVAEGGRYTLVKQLSAYNSDIYGNLAGDDYFNRTTGYARDFTYFLIDADSVLTEEQANDSSLYVPALLGAREYGTLIYEFHADTGKYYYTFDLGDSLDKDIVLFGGSTGAMEQMFNFPFSYRRLSIGYDSMVRITDWDYTPVEGDSFTYREQAPFYAGYADNDFADSNTVYDMLENYSYAVRMVNIFYSSANGGISGNKNYDTKVTISPTAATSSGGALADMRYKFSYFDIVCEAYGYDVLNDGALYSSAISYTSLMSFGHSNSDRKAVDIGKTVELGTEIDLFSLYQEKVYAVASEGTLSWQGYELDAKGNADFTKPVDLAPKFTFTKNIAVLFTSTYDGNQRTGLVTLMKKERPVIEIESDEWRFEDGVYVTDARYKIDDLATVPEITYEWLGRTYTSRSMIKYEDEDHDYRTDFLRTAVWEYANGIYTRVFSQFMDEGVNDVFTMSSEWMRVTFKITNRFGEFETITLEYRGDNVGFYTIYVNGTAEQSGELTYTDDKRDPLEYENAKAYELSTQEDVNTIPNDIRLDIIDGEESSEVMIPFVRATIYLKDSTQTVYSINELWNKIDGQNYAIIFLFYENNYGDTALCKALYNFTIDAENLSEYKVFEGGTDLFTGQTFELEAPKIAGADFKPIKRGNLTIYRIEGNNAILAGAKEWYTREEGSFGDEVCFLQEGIYELRYSFRFDVDLKGNIVVDAYDPSDSTTALVVSICRRITVNDSNGDISVTYATDKEHPFDMEKLEGGTLAEDENYYYYTVKVSMAEKNRSLDSSVFKDSADRLYGWSSSDDISGRLFMAGGEIGQLGVTMNSLTPTIYALWDEGIVINVYYDKDNTDDNLIGSFRVYRSNSSNNDYQTYSIPWVDIENKIDVNTLVGYKRIEWKASRAIFQEGYGINAVYYDTYEIDGSYMPEVNVKEGVDLWLVVKKELRVNYAAVDTNGNEVQLQTVLRADSVLEDDILAQSVTTAKLNQLNSVSCTDPTKEFKYWAVMVNGELKEFNIYSDELKAEYIESGKTIVLYAVFGDKEVGV